MKSPYTRLVGLARLRADAAARSVARAEALVAQAKAGIATAVAAAEAVSAAAEAERAAAREAFIGAPQSRLAVELLLSGLSGLRDREVAAQDAIATARRQCAKAEADLLQAQRNAAECDIALEKRTRAIAPILKAGRQQSELNAESEAAENWQSGAGSQ